MTINRKDSRILYDLEELDGRIMKMLVRTDSSILAVHDVREKATRRGVETKVLLARDVKTGEVFLLEERRK